MTNMMEGPPMPRHARGLINLRYSPVFNVVGNKYHEFGTKSTLDHLGYKLCIDSLENLSSKEDAEEARIGEEQNIVWLELNWRWRRTESGVRNDLEVFQGLQPHRNLQKLGISEYVSLNFSTSMMDLNNLLPNLVSVVLEHCSSCEELPPLGLLPFLKVLKIEGFLALKRIGREFFVGNSTSESFFPCLEDLSILHMENLEEWNDHISKSASLSSHSSSNSSSRFPLLEKLKVMSCPKLRIMQTRISYLKELEIEYCTDEAINSLVESNITSLTSVSIRECNKLVVLPLKILGANSILEYLLVDVCSKFKGFNVDQDSEEEEKKENTNLNSLTLHSCPSISWPNISRFNYLVDLNLEDCGNYLESFPSSIENLPRLQILTVGPFSDDLDYFPFPAANINEDTNVGVYFPSLVSLSIQGWYKLNCLPDQMQHISSLQNLIISSFDSLEVLPEWLGNMVSLMLLKLYRCDNLVYLPSNEQMLRLTSLRRLEIEGCPLLAEKCEEGGEEHYKISNIPGVYIERDQDE